MTAAHRLDDTARNYVLALYGCATLGYYLFTWYGYGGWGPGHPPLWNLEEFMAASGLKFSIYFVLSCGLYRWLWPAAIRRGPAILLTGLLVGLVVFTLSAHSLQTNLLAAFGWVPYFGGSRAILNDLLSAGFYLVQLCVVLGLRAVQPRNSHTVQSPPPSAPPSATLTKGELTLVVAWEDIAYLKAYGNYARAWVDGDAYLYSQGIGAAEAAAGNSFLRVHRSYLINGGKLRGLRRDGRSTLAELCDGTRVPVGRSYLLAVREWLGADRSSPG